MNKKILGVFASLVFVAMIVTPVLAKPTQGQKVAITLTWTRTLRIQDPPVFTGVVMHRHVYIEWSVVLEIEDGPTLTGTGTSIRDNVRMPQKDGDTVVIRDVTELWFPDQQGGFEGRGVIMIDGLTSPGVWEQAKAHELLQGTGEFEGQTLNAGHHWEEPSGAIVWTGYWLKYEP